MNENASWWIKFRIKLKAYIVALHANGLICVGISWVAKPKSLEAYLHRFERSESKYSDSIRS